MKPKTLHNIGNSLGVVVAVIFLISGFAKAADCAYFSNILWRTYSWQWLALSAPIIVLIEIGLGLGLLTGLYRRVVAVGAALFLAVISAGYMYGVLVHGMTNCGCFGHLSFLNLSPTFTLVRNGGMILMLVLAAIWGTSKSVNRVRRMVIFVGLLIGTFACAYTLPKASVLFERQAHCKGQRVENTPLQSLQLSPDSTYMVFLFSFDCPFCMNAVANVAWYEKSGIVDRVIGIATEDSIAEQTFRSYYQDTTHTYPLTSPFTIQVRPMEQVQAFTSNLPMAYIIRHDTIITAWSGEVPPGIFFY